MQQLKLNEQIDQIIESFYYYSKLNNLWYHPPSRLDCNYQGLLEGICVVFTKESIKLTIRIMSDGTVFVNNYDMLGKYPLIELWGYFIKD